MTSPTARRAAGGLVAALVTALLLGGCATADQAVAPEPVIQTDELDGQGVQAVSPPEGVAVRALVVYLHGQYESADATTVGDDVARVADALARAGYVVVSSDAHGDNFGSPAAQRDYAALAAQASSRYGTTATFLLAESMGGLSAVPLAADGAVPDLLGTAGINPALRLTGPGSGDYSDEVDAAWGRAPSAADDPLATPPADLAGQHFRFYVSDGDTVVPTAQHAGAFAEVFGPVADVELVTCTGEHVDSSCFQPDDLLAWFDGLLAARS